MFDAVACECGARVLVQVKSALFTLIKRSRNVATQNSVKKRRKNSNIGVAARAVFAQGWGTRQHKFLLNYGHFICSLSLFGWRFSSAAIVSLGALTTSIAEFWFFRFIFHHEVLSKECVPDSSIRWRIKNKQGMKGNASFQSTLEWRFVNFEIQKNTQQVRWESLHSNHFESDRGEFCHSFFRLACFFSAFHLCRKIANMRICEFVYACVFAVHEWYGTGNENNRAPSVNA